ncbi:MAG: tRNA 4-thiouridine(8) synthase ThiI [Epsilonproteobacteria bacterium]|nr:tRNA 4-thiouridine(8) synthase ThiI [Campylobacterota bacterium]
MIKGSSAKRQMVGQLYANLTNILEKIDAGIEVKKHSDKIEIYSPLSCLEAVKQKLTNTSGIETVLEVTQVDNITTLDALKVAVEKLVAPKLTNKTFVVRAKRSGKHPFTSMDIERSVGGYLLAHTQAKKVQLKNPDITVEFELIQDQLNLITARYSGLSGFPLGTQGDILSLMSGGFDSTIASYLTMKRGIKTHFIFFNLGGMAHEIGVKQVAFYLWSKFASSHKVKFISIPFDDVIGEIFASTPPTYMGVMLKRLMLQASEQIADKLEIDALLTGESVAQVSSQTLRNLALIDQATNKLVLRPLATMNKPEIIALAEKIGTRHFAENMPEYCGVISQNPITHGSFKRMEKVAQKFNYDVLQKAVDDAKIIDIDTVVDDVNQLQAVEIVNEIDPDKHTIIDIRTEGKELTTKAKQIAIPFHNLKKEFEKLPQNKEYLLYCDKGVMSQLHAQYLIDHYKCDNVKVYRPKED